MSAVPAKKAAPPIGGTTAPGFARLRDAFAANFEGEGEYADHGAALAVYVDGECITDLWGGYADAAREKPWRRDTLVNVWSTSKGATAASLAKLVDEGRLSYNDPVAKHWPAFAAAGKQDISVAMLLSHQGGLNGFDVETSVEDLFDWTKSTQRLAAQAPFWRPGAAASYHAITFGHLAGELLRQIDGRSLGRFFQEEFAAPLQADFFIGLPDAEELRVAEIIAPMRRSSGLDEAVETARRAVVNPSLDPTLPWRRDWRRAEIPAANGQASAQGVARLYGALANGGALGDACVLSAEAIEALRTERHGGPDLLLGVRRWASGVALNTDQAFGPNTKAFGHGGWGGSLGCADPEEGVGVGYVLNRMGAQLVGDPRSKALCAAVYECLGEAGA